MKKADDTENSAIQTNRLCKIVYFDENSVTDYIQIIAGGKLEKTTELFKESNSNGSAGAGAKGSIGVSGVFKALLGLEASASAESSAETSFSTNKMAKNIVKNTILTDFIDILEQDTIVAKSKNQKISKVIRKFRGYSVSAPKDSLSYVALISPYLSMLKGGAGFPAGDYNIAIDKLDNTIKAAKGYYEFVGSKKADKVILRFNINSFKNNYKAPDLLKMDISIFAIKVGMSTIDKLNINSELEIDTFDSRKDNPSYQKNDKRATYKSSDSIKPLEVYDVLLAGVESDD